MSSIGALMSKARLATRVVGWFALVEVGLRARPLPALCRWLGVRLEPGPPPAPPRHLTSERAMRTARAVNRVNGRWPWGGTCLRRSLVLGRLLADLSPTLVLGVRRDDAGEIAVHAWLEVGGRSIDPDSAMYAVLPLS